MASELEKRVRTTLPSTKPYEEEVAFRPVAQTRRFFYSRRPHSFPLSHQDIQPAPATPRAIHHLQGVPTKAPQNQFQFADGPENRSQKQNTSIFRNAALTLSLSRLPTHKPQLLCRLPRRNKIRRTPPKKVPKSGDSEKWKGKKKFENSGEDGDRSLELGTHLSTL